MALRLAFKRVLAVKDAGRLQQCLFSRLELSRAYNRPVRVHIIIHKR